MDNASRFRSLPIPDAEAKWLIQLARRAMFLSEVVGKRHSPCQQDQADLSELAVTRWKRWLQVAAADDPVVFHRLLHTRGLNADHVKRVLGSPCLGGVSGDAPSPRWTETLYEIIQAARSTKAPGVFNTGSRESIAAVTSSGVLLPFQDILVPLLAVAKRKLHADLERTSLCLNDLFPSVLSDAAYQALEASLLERLVTLCGETLQNEFMQYRPAGWNMLYLMDLLSDPGSLASEHQAYLSFVQMMLEEGLASLFDQYPVLGRLVAITVDFWVEGTVEFIQRLNRDRPVLQHQFGGGIEPGPVVALGSGLSDLYNRGRSVLSLQFRSGLKVMYKPRDVRLESAFCRFVDWCNTQSGLLHLQALKILDRSGYGWVEHISASPCRDRSSVERLYHRAGVLLCLIYALRGTDAHYQNVIVSDEQMVLIDMETMMHHPRATPAGQTSYDVLSTDLLPCWVSSEDGRLVWDVSALGAISRQELPGLKPEWKNVNSDGMYIEYCSRFTSVRTNIVILDGVVLSPSNYVGQIVAGFTDMYRFVESSRDALMRLDSPLRWFRDLPVRAILRDTAEYRALEGHLHNPSYMRDGVDFGIEMESLARRTLSGPSGTSAFEILQAEIRQLEQIDTPYFGACSTSTALSIGVTEPVESYFSRSGFDATMAHLQRFDKKDLALQIALIEGAFRARANLTHTLS